MAVSLLYRSGQLVGTVRQSVVGKPDDLCRFLLGVYLCCLSSTNDRAESALVLSLSSLLVSWFITLCSADADSSNVGFLFGLVSF